MMRRILTLICTVFSIGVLVVAIQIIRINKGHIHVNYVSHSKITSSPSADFKYFFEPKANTIQEDEVSAFNAKYTINGDTLNERYDYRLEKNPGVYRIIVLGDSFAYGLHVNTMDNWTELLEDYLNAKPVCESASRFEVINLGVSGYDRAYALQRFINRGEKYNPDLVIWFDFEPYRNTEKINEIFSKYIDDRNAKEVPENFKSKIQDELIAKTSEIELNEKLMKTTDEFMKYHKGPLLLLALPSMKKPEKEALKKIAVSHSNVFYFDGLIDIYASKLTPKCIINS